MKDLLHEHLPRAGDALAPIGAPGPLGSAAAAGAEPGVLVVADDLRAAERWCESLQGEGVSTRCCLAPATAAAEAPAALVLHVSARLAERLDSLRELHARHPRVPLLVVCQRLRDLDHVLALEMGADDVQDAAASPAVLAARLRALARRRRDANVNEAGPEQLCFGRLSLHLRERRVTLGGENRPLTEGEFEVLWLLALNAGNPVSRAELLRRLRGLPYQRIDRSIDCRVYRIRGKLGDSDGPSQRIRTMRNCGYLFSSAPW